jgi:short-subunit dehydrogenase
MDQSSKGYALITGASAGIGAVYADRLARRGYDLILVARNRAKLDAVARAISGETGRRVETIAADLTDPADLGKVEAVLRTDGRITALVNNAGIAATATLLQSDVERMSQMVAINVDALMRLTYAAAPAFAARGAGTIINISSVAAIATEIVNGVYAGTKAFVLAFSESMARELADTGVRVQVVLPGAVATDLWETAGTPLDQLAPERVMSARAMVDAALAGLDQGEFATLPSLPDPADWQAYDRARNVLRPNLSHRNPAARYL